MISIILLRFLSVLAALKSTELATFLFNVANWQYIMQTRLELDKREAQVVVSLMDG